MFLNVDETGEVMEAGIPGHGIAKGPDKRQPGTLSRPIEAPMVCRQGDFPS